MPVIKFNLPKFDPANIASKLPEPLQWPVGTALGGLKEAAKAITGGDDENPTSAMQVGLGGPMMAAEGELTPIAQKAKDVLGGLYSRVNRAAQSLPESIHPNKAMSIFKNQANPEEVNYRGLGDFLKGKGNEQVKKADILSHLEANPEPEVNLVSKPGKPMFEDSRYTAGGPPDPDKMTKYHSYQLPGGENYRENLITTPVKQEMRPVTEATSMHPRKPEDAGFFINPDEEWDPDGVRNGIYTTHTETSPSYIRDVNTNADHRLDIDSLPNELITHQETMMKPHDVGGYQSPHWDEPNVLVHSRTQDRSLTGPGQWGPEHFSGGEDQSGLPIYYPEEGPQLDREFKFHTPSGGVIHGFGTTREEALQQLLDDLKGPNTFAAQEMGNELPPSSGPKIRNIENIQSDWHQAGAKGGYANDPPNAKLLEMYNRASQDADAAYDNLQYTMAKYAHLNSNEFDAHPTAHSEVQAARDAYTNAQDIKNDIDFEPNSSIPDAPFKDKGWLDLALKHQLLDVANDPSIEGISITPGEELMRRGEGQSPKFNNEVMPNALKRLLKPFGGGEPSMLELGDKPIPRPNGTFGTIIGGETGNPDLPYSGNVLLNKGYGDISNIASIWPHAATRNDAISRVHLLKDLVNQTQPLSRSPSLQTPFFRITPEMKKLIQEKGLPLLSLLGLGYGGDQNNSKVER